MSSVTDAIKEEIPITDYAEKCGYTVTHVGRQCSLREHDSIRIDPERNIFFRHSTGLGGSVIDFAMFIHGIDKAEAISTLRKELTPDSLTKTRPSKPYEHKAARPTGPLILPPKVQGGGKKNPYSRVYAYLSKSRGIDSAIITDMVNRKQLYEDDHHNCVFVGFDKESVPAFACARGTSTYAKNPFRRDYENSRKEIGFYVDNQASRLLVCEAPIDAMSLMTVLKRNKRDYKKFDYLAIAGMCYDTLPYHLERLGMNQLKTIFLAPDNDEKGAIARKGYREQLQSLGYTGKVIDKIPIAKDWNKDLCDLLGIEQSVKPLLNHTQNTIPKAPQPGHERSLSL